MLLNELRQTEWEKINEYLEKNKYITNEVARQITHVKQRDIMTRLLNKWCSQGLLKKIVPKSGYVKGTKYRLPVSNEINSR